MHRKAVELNPLSSFSMTQLGWNLIIMGRFDEGLTWFKKSLEVDPGSPYALFSIGMYHAGILGDYGEAVKWLRRSSLSDCWFSLFRIHWTATTVSFETWKENARLLMGASTSI